MATPDLIRLDIVVDEEQYDTVAGLLVRNISYGVARVLHARPRRTVHRASAVAV